MSKRIIKLSVISLMCSVALPVFAAKSVDLSHQNIQYLKSLTASKTFAATAGVSIKETSQSTDFNQTSHTRIQQHYAGYPVWGGDAVIHTPQGKNKNLHSLMASADTAQSTMNGNVYEDLQKDLQSTPAHVFTDAQGDKALAQAIINFKNKTGMQVDVLQQKKQLMVYVDKKAKAHWAFYVQARVSANGSIAIPTYIMDANDFRVYKEWNDLKTLDTEPVQGGGLGGNLKSKFVYDGLAGNLAKLDMERNAKTKTCYLQNSLAKVFEFKGMRRGREMKELAHFDCEKLNTQHDNIYWNEGEIVNGGYSPNNDALFAAKVINDMYQSWYHVPVLVKKGKPMVLSMVTHMVFEFDGGMVITKENAAWDDYTESMYFGDGETMFYPLTSLGIAAHEISHGFTSQHSNLEYFEESGAMNESFSDMADQAANYFATGENDFKVGANTVKKEGKALRYLEKPSLDGHSADSYADYLAYAEEHRQAMEVHSSSGIYNRAFYLLATSQDWNVRKAFDVMVKANSDYWTATSTFKDGACGVVKAAVDYKYDTVAVKDAFEKVGVVTNGC